MSVKEFELLPKLARSQPVVDKAKLQNASSVEEALDIARSSLKLDASVWRRIVKPGFELPNIIQDFLYYKLQSNKDH